MKREDRDMGSQKDIRPVVRITGIDEVRKWQGDGWRFSQMKAMTFSAEIDII
jgi:hypothetical protein